ncbi:MAG: DUF4012 domain-containing protein, partial [Acidimicrobiia bacterium]
MALAAGVLTSAGAGTPAAVSTAALLLVAGASFVAVALVAIVVPRWLRASPSWAVPVLIAVGAGLGIVAEGAATRLSVIDAVLRGALGASFVAAGAAAGPRARLVACVIVAIPPFFESGGGLPAMLALGAALASVAIGLDGPVLGAAVGVGIGQAALHLGWPRPAGASALVAFAALLVLAVPVLLRVSRPLRRRMLIPLAVLGGALVLVVGAYAVLVLMARGNVTHGIDAANAGLAEAHLGNTTRAAQRFDEARAAFQRADDLLGSWVGKPVLAVPLVAQQARALSKMSSIGVRLATSGAKTARAADPQATRLVNGTFPIAKIAALETPLTEARTSLRAADTELATIDSTWLAAPIDNKLTDLEQRVKRSTHDAETGIEAARVVPALLGGNGKSRRYFVAFETPAEQRASGGIIGNFAIITFTDGHLDLTRSGRSRELNDGGSFIRTLTGPADYLQRYAGFRPQYTWQNVTMSPDWPSVAQVIEGLYPQSGGEPVDGVVSVDPIALGALLKLTGPVHVDGLDEPLTAQNAARILLKDQYVVFPDKQERVDFLGNAVDAVIHRLQQGDLPGAARIGKVLGPMVKQGRLKLQTTDPAGQRFFDRVHLTGGLPPVRGDFAGLVTQNASGNKIDIFLHRSVQYATRINPKTSTATSTVTVTLRNDAPASGLPDYVIGGAGPNPTAPGVYRSYLSFYTPLALRQATIDGRPATFTTAAELGRNVLSTFLDVPSGGTVTIRLQLSGKVALPKVDGGRRYRLQIWQQPTSAPDHVSVKVTGASGVSLTDGRNLEERG